MAMVNDTQLAEVRFPVTAGLVATMLVGVMSLIYWMASGSVEELVVFVAASTAAAGAILTAFHSARSLALTAGALRKMELKYSRINRPDRRFA